MARIRTTKPEFWTDGKVVQLSPFARLLFLGSWNFALCDDGHLPDDVFGLKLKVLPADDVDPTELLDELLFAEVIVRGELPDGRSYLHIRRLRDHQKTDARWVPRCFVCAAVKTPETTTDPAETHRNSREFERDSVRLTETPPNSPQEGKGKERKGRSTSTAPAASRGTRIPEDYRPPSELVDFARTRGFTNPQIVEITAEFIDYWRGVPGAKGVKLDWDGTWRNWVRRKSENVRTLPARPSGGARYTDEVIQPRSAFSAVVDR